ncbi:MAG: hypothetical protein LCH91_13520 [Bacteroidetes bacterium]|nr:hypothetical protein [Bacteroidota bacterium]
MDKIKSLHRIAGIIIAIFAAAHLFNHAMAWYGIETHQLIMASLRTIYRNPVVEFLLITSVLFQVYSGIQLFRRWLRDGERTLSAKLQAYSGVLFAFFILQHVGATLSQRFGSLDTDFYFAARVVLETPLKYYFIPYYFMGIMAFGVHIGTTHTRKMTQLHRERAGRIQAIGFVVAMLTLAVLILYIFMGGSYSIVIPAGKEVFSF